MTSATSHLFALICDDNGKETVVNSFINAKAARDTAEEWNRNEVRIAAAAGVPPAVYFVRQVKVRLARRPSAATVPSNN